MLKLDDALHRLRKLPAGHVLAGLVQDIEDALGAGHGGLDLAVELGQLVDGPGKLLGVDDKGGDDAHGDGAAENKPGAEHRHDDEGEVAEHIHHRAHHVADDLGDDAGAGQGVGGLGEGLHGLGLLVVGGDGAGIGHHLLHGAVDLAQQLLALHVIFSHIFGDDPGEHHRQHDGGAAQQRQRHAVPQHHRQRADQRQNAGEQGAEGLGDHIGDILRVVGHAAHDVAVGVVVDIADGQGHDLPEQIRAHPPHHPLAQGGAEIALDQRGNALGQIEDQHGGEDGRQIAEDPGNDPVHRLALDAGGHHGADHRHGDHCCQQAHQRQLRAEILQQPAEGSTGVFGLLHRRAHTGAAAAYSLLDGGGGDFCGLAHAPTSSRSWELTMSR